MPGLYYSLRINNGNPKNYFWAELRKKANHPFLSPVGTKVYIEMESYCNENSLNHERNPFYTMKVMELRDYLDMCGRYEGDFHMVLNEEEDTTLDGELKTPDAKLLVDFLVLQGWELIGTMP